jgi:uncharacterized protein (DUF2141 family)
VRSKAHCGKLVRILLLLCVLAPQVFAEDSYSLSISITGINPGQGTVVASLFDSKKGFLRTPSRSLKASVGDANVITLTFESMVPGTYAVSVIHDVNDNGKLDTNFFRIPREPVGTSNDPKPRMGPPKWEAAKFELLEDMRIEISIRKPD